MVLGDYISQWKEVFSWVPQGSVLGPILFVIFINDIADAITSHKKLFADDTNIFSIINSNLDSIQLQNDINSVVEWCRLWLMRLNEAKCKVMHIGNQNKQYPYTIDTNGGNQLIIVKTTRKKDLGVVITNDLR